MESENWNGFDDVVTSYGAIEARVLSDGLRLRVFCDGHLVLDDIRLGLEVDGVDLGDDCVLDGSATSRIAESYLMRTGKAAGEHRFEHEETTLSLHDRVSGRAFGVVVRVARDGIAFRYRLPADAAHVEVGAELTRIAVPQTARAWMLDYQTWYETPRFGADLAALSTGDYGFPALIRQTDGTHVLISESGIDGRFSGAHLNFDQDRSEFSVVTADLSTTVAGDTLMPWRVLIIGDAPEVVASNLVDDLAPAADPALAEADWIRPGRAAWSWWSDMESPAKLDVQKRFADYAADHGWEYVLADGGWDPAWMPEFVKYATGHRVQVLVWSHWSDLDGAEALKKLAMWKSWGVVGVKVDFMESESQERYQWYDAIIAEAARLGLMINFHGSVIPRGWARTYPHVMSYEGIRGAEYYIIDLDSPTASHNVIQPFTRNVVGSMDYTPVTFSAADRETSDGHELGMSVVFESGISHFADDVAEYARRPLAEEFLQRLAPFWHETRLLSGSPDTEAVVARRHDDRWYIGCIATGSARTVTVDVSVLVDRAYDAWVVVDALQQPGLVELRLCGSTKPTLEIGIAKNGGFAGIVVPAGSSIT